MRNLRTTTKSSPCSPQLEKAHAATTDKKRESVEDLSSIAGVYHLIKQTNRHINKQTKTLPNEQWHS